MENTHGKFSIMKTMLPCRTLETGGELSLPRVAGSAALSAARSQLWEPARENGSGAAIRRKPV